MRGRPFWCTIVFIVVCLFLGPGALGVPDKQAAPGAGWDLDHADVGFSPSFALFPDHDEVMSRVDALADHPWMTVHEVGHSEEGRAIKLVEVVHPDNAVPVDDRVVTLLLTQQHGNEPAGTPAALDLLEQIADNGSVADTLRDQVLLVIPMMNPDGATQNARANSEGYDTNRDHNHLHTSEARTLHEVLTRWTVHVAMDHHEYGGTGVGNPVPVRIYDHDLTALFPTHEGVHPSVQTMAENLLYDGILPAAQEAGYSANEYGEVTAAGIPLGYLAGGPDPGILRNHFGIHHVAGILIETRVDSYDNPFHDMARRVDIQHLTMVATLQYVSDHAGLFIGMKDHAIQDHEARAPEWYHEGDFAFLTDDPVDGSKRPRERIPAAYRLADDPHEVNRLLGMHGLPEGVLVDGALVHNVDHGWPVHSAALFSSASQRHVFEGAPTAAVPTNATDGDPLGPEVERSPGLQGLVLVALLGFVLLGLVRARR